MGGNSAKQKKPEPEHCEHQPAPKQHYGKRKQLYCRTGYFLAIMQDGTVAGIDEDMHPNAIVEFTTVKAGEVRIRGTKANLYLAMNKTGRLYGEANVLDESTVFLESLHRHHLVYLSKPYARFNWYVALKKNGKPKDAKKTKLGQKAIQFLTVKLLEDR
ncbi:fibroblast growth factor 1-like [Cimex lectularius]|uniref:Fibroblast growth factor n=1 Tax=Cimex lectularius TaxID=79782 RepID=A0A8I6S004_CIMLE|nr:fibroblast growth factor 1-like [Cimex lectularius]XP_014254542.1 fibroblast growth factor 1-like [Cimex lectularius]